jgi:hypothetical protein
MLNANKIVAGVLCCAQQLKLKTASVNSKGKAKHAHINLSPQQCPFHTRY